MRARMLLSPLAGLRPTTARRGPPTATRGLRWMGDATRRAPTRGIRRAPHGASGRAAPRDWPHDGVARGCRRPHGRCLQGEPRARVRPRRRGGGGREWAGGNCASVARRRCGAVRRSSSGDAGRAAMGRARARAGACFVASLQPAVPILVGFLPVWYSIMVSQATSRSKETWQRWLLPRQTTRPRAAARDHSPTGSCSRRRACEAPK